MSAITQQIYEHAGSLPLKMQEETLDFIQFLKTRLLNAQLKLKQSKPNGAKLAQLMEEASKKSLFTHMQDPCAWQREIRRDRPLPLREEPCY